MSKIITADYLKIGNAQDLKGKEKIIYRFLEILPGLLSWLTLFFLFFFSFKKPFWVAIFIILFDLYWLIKTVYLSIHLRSAYQKMKETLKVNWLEKLKNDYPNKWQEITHLIILPMYKEPLEIVEESFLALTKANYPKEKFIVVLSIEEKNPKRKEIADYLKKKFENKFFKLLITFHPKNLKGEIAGKGANESWAAKEADEKIIKPLNLTEEKIIVSSFDVDSVIFKDYFAYLTYKFLSTPNNQRASYQPIPLFLNNIWQANPVSRVMAFSSTFWHTLNQDRPEKKITFSSHSLPFKPLKEINFWQKNVVSEDSRIFWNFFLYFNGNWRVVPLYYPISMDANTAPKFWQTLKNIYKQQRRWAYGVADVSYFLYGFLKNKKIPLKKKFRYGFPTFAGFYSWATNALIIFLGGWLPLIFGEEKFRYSLLASHLPFLTRDILTIAMVGIVSSAVLTIQILPPRPPNYPKRSTISMVLQWLLVPITLIIFGSLPALEAQTRLLLGKYLDFWFTPKTRQGKRKD